MKKLLVALVALIALVAAAVTTVVAFLRGFLPETEGRVELNGIHGPVEIVRDHWGVPHIYATSEEDLFFAQGYVHAQDRMWQMELQRRAGAGRLAEILGEPALEIDRTFRTLGLNRAAEDEAAALSGESLAVLQAYSAGVNAYMRLRRGSLGIEFRLLGFEPQPWRPVDSFYWAKVLATNLSGNMTSEVLRARLARQVGADLAADLEPSYPASNPVTVPGDGSPPQPNGWRSDALRDALRLVEQMLGGPATPPPAAARSPLSGVIPLNPSASNQWVVDGAHSATGRPLLANDTHMMVAMPALWYQAHLSGGRYQVAGVSMPGVPGVVIGHNDHIAWGMTTGWQDSQDLYVEKVNPANPREFEFRGKWEKAEVVREVILVKGRSAPLVEEVLITRHGPIVSKLGDEKQPLALRWTAHDVTDPVSAFLGVNRAKDWNDFRAALDKWVTPPHNFVYADTAGNIGFLQAGRVPVRGKGHGMAPAPGWTGEYEWERFLTVDEIPQVFNPEQGWIAVANNVVVAHDYPYFLSADLEDSVRATRIAELLQSQDTFSAAEFARFQRDTASAHARRFVQHLLKIQPTNTREAAVLDLLRAWDCKIDADSVAASIYHVCQLNALHTIFDRHLGEQADGYIGIDITGLGDFSLYQGRTTVRLLEMLDNPRDTTWLRDPMTGIPETKTEVLHRALRITLKQMIATYGADMTKWTWGRLHRVEFAHIAGAVKPLNLLFNRGPYPMGGDNETLLRATTRPEFPFKPAGAIDAMRFVADVSDWDRSQIMVAGGQSGHVASKHYDDLIPLWRDGLTVPMPFSRAAVERSAGARLTLYPKQRGMRTNGADPM
ncbi:MAG: penicillin acylase family protein [Anaerolineae bacterium]|nr:penicillin acylase family protein [Anaerolineae bacterium]